MSQIAVIGDVHGCYENLARLVEALPTEVRRYVFVGDYVDRGPQSRMVIDFCLRLRATGLADFVRGNHDDAFLRFIQTGEIDRYLAYGGAPTLRSYIHRFDGDFVSRALEAIPSSHVEFLESLVPNVAIGDLAVTHGPRDPLPDGDFRFRISGHTPTASSTPIVRANYAHIDTGCGTLPGAPLTCLLWPSLRVFQA